MSDLNELFKALAEAKAEDPTNKRIKKIKESIKHDINNALKELKGDLEQQLVEAKQEDMLVEVSPIPAQPVIRTPEQRIKDTNADVNKYLTGKSFQQPNPDPVDRNLEAIQTKMKFLEQAIGRIAATGPGGGEVNLRWLDDVDRSSISDMRFLRYNDTKKKFEFAEVNPHDIVYNTHLVTTSTYVMDSDDYYVGVNYAGPTTITLPTTLLSSGRSVVIKDESGAAETNPITVVGNVDNDSGGFVIQINNGATQLIYRNGWRII